MKSVFILKWLLLQSQKYKVLHYKSFPQLCTLTLFSTYSVNTQEYPFLNSNRPQDLTALRLNRPDLPLEVKLLSKNQKNIGRVYFGNNPSVTTILDATRPNNELYALLNWKTGLVKELGEAGYIDKMTRIRNRGVSFHQAVRQYLSSGSQPILHESNIGHWKSIQHVISNIEQVIALESGVIHPQLHYAGTLDGIISYQGKLCVIDWKTSEKKRFQLKDCYSYPHQIVAYAGAVNFDQNYHPIQVKHGLLVLAYPDGLPANTIWMSPDTCEHYWREWSHRLRAYRQTIMNTPCKLNQGKNMQDLACSVNGIETAHVKEEIESCNTILNAPESTINVFNLYPSTCDSD